MSRIKGDRPAPRIPTRADKVRVPLWMLLLAVAGKGLWLAVRWSFRHRIAVAVVVGLLLFTHRFGPVGLAALAGGLAVATVVWARLHPRSCAWAGHWMWGRVRLTFVYRWRWRDAMVHTDLAIRMPTSNADQVMFDEYFPRIRTIRSTRAVDTLRVELLPGQTPEQWAEQGEALRHVFRARRCQVQAETFRFVRLHFHHRDTLTRPVTPTHLDEMSSTPGDADPDPAGADPDPTPNRMPLHTAYARLIAGLSGIPVGRCEDGSAWTLPVRGTHVLVAGATGAGKGSVLWSLLRGLGPAVRAGLVELWVCDPKGGMELAFGQALFTRFATTTDTIAALLDDAVGVMRDRTARLSGVTRLHTPTTTEPLIVLVVDEIASLTAYVTDRDLKKRIGAALPLLLSQGRAPGVVVLAAVQDPRKDVLPFRDLFPVRVALRMTEPDQADLVLGSGSRDRGARAEEIPLSLPGVGYVLHDGNPDPIRVRAAFIDDDEIARTVHTYRPAMAGGWVPDLDAFTGDDDPDGAPDQLDAAA
ncbi:FtsK/SpoIIIE domain-containing protein [Frankia sp. AgKG'84/4]|uniref:FtsK/SpoIIIE domain-containing protein n=1 Tax=Frankia sp. AgKG'84/4 TaxID=573490 RepID=UPI00200D8345|nr:FtsK/SpoIIIE domain-containing protein [Frankia sp. AgKG'84/4]MCL9794045.1 FtsK/SpoIIIE domain-containing protein [Frankia sp. AgKG'84/4]